MTIIGNQAARLIRRLREEARLTQSELAERVGTTQSVISRLESEDYEGHSLSMLYRVASALDRRVEMRTVDADAPTLEVRERVAGYRAEADAVTEQTSDDTPRGGVAAAAALVLTPEELERFAQRLAGHGITRAEIDEAIRWARGADSGALDRLRGIVQVGPGSTIDDVHRSRAQRGWAIVNGA